MRSISIWLFLITFVIYAITATAAEKILIVGDSLSAGYGIDVSESWIKLLEQRMQSANHEAEIINASVSGMTTSAAMSQIDILLQTHRPTICVLALGGNDGLQGVNISTIQRNLATMIKKFKAQHCRVLVLGVRLPMNYGKRYRAEFEAIFPSLAKRHRVLVVPFLLKGIDDQVALMQEDGIHPNAQAQKYILENVWSVLEPLLKNSGRIKSK